MFSYFFHRGSSYILHFKKRVFYAFPFFNNIWRAAYRIYTETVEKKFCTVQSTQQHCVMNFL
jgi:hypothetical protein